MKHTHAALIALFLLSACNTAGPAFRGVEATRIAVDGSVFDVRVRDNRAEAIRVNAQYAPRFGPIRQRAAFAMAQASGCKVTRVDGDQAQAIGQLACKGRPEGWSAPRGPVSYSCLEVARWLGTQQAEFECDPI